ncbi:MAG: hypothetical protein K0U72_03035 [Gammaproteobacteria bacterium]|nr:hypothetical protein [Gammaproteobacteria bacterium]
MTFMHVHDLKLPLLLIELIDRGIWPRSEDEVNAQNLQPLLDKEAASKVSTDEECIVLMAPPFHTISDEIRDGNSFWNNDLTNVGVIDYSRAVIVADFGLGSDSPIILYYVKDNQTPVVMYLRWQGNGADISHSWLQTHDTFNQFATDVGLVGADD